MLLCDILCTFYVMSEADITSATRKIFAHDCESIIVEQLLLQRRGGHGIYNGSVGFVIVEMPSCLKSI